jgi:hypothetical protein
VHRTRGTRRCANEGGGGGRGARSGYIEKMHIFRLRIRAQDKRNAWVCKWRRCKRCQKWVQRELLYMTSSNKNQTATLKDGLPEGERNRPNLTRDVRGRLHATFGGRYGNLEDSF